MHCHNLNNYMKKTFKNATLALLFGLGSLLTARAQVNGSYYLLVGFTQKGGNTGGNDLIYALGYPPDFTDGQTWNLSSLLSGQSFIITSANFQWGAVGDAGSDFGIVPQLTWVTTSGTTPDSINGEASFNAITTPVNSMEQNFSGGFAANPGDNLVISSANDNSWNGQTITAPNRTSLENVLGYSPNQTSSGSLSLWQVADDNTAPMRIGYLTLNTNGVLTFSSSLVATPPVPKIVSIVHAATASTVYFTTTNGFTYKLYYTNSTGLTAPVATWPTVGSTVAGNGLTNSITDSTAADSTRFYRVGVQ